MAFKSDLGEIAATIPADETINALYIELPLPVRGNVSIEAHAVDTDDALDAYSNQSEEKFKKSGLSVSVSNSLVDSAKSIDNLVDAAGNTSSTRMKGMAAVSGALKARALAQESKKALGALQSGNLKGVGNTRIQATVGSDKRQSNNESYNERSQASTIQAAGNLSLIATGGGKDSNININGSDIDVVGNALFKADNDFNVNGVAQKSYTRSNNKSSSVAIGGYADTSGSAGITANASGAKGHGNSDATSYANSHINVGGTTTFDIGNDVNIKGGVFNTDKAQGNIGGDVNIESLQDTATYDGKQRNIGFSADIDLNAGKGTNFSLNGGKTDISADHAAVGEQSGIFTGDGGFDITVDGKTTLKGGAITTTQAALDQGLNKYISKGGIETSDIDNYSRYEGDSISAGVSISGVNRDEAGKYDKDGDTSWSTNTNGIGYGSDGDSQTSTTFAGVTGMAGKSEVTTASKDSLNEPLKNSFDEQKVTEELGAQTQITKEFGKEAPKAVGDFASNRQMELLFDGNIEEAKKWGEGGQYRVALHTLTSALATGSIEGAFAGGATAVSVPALDNYLKKKGYDETTRNAVLLGFSVAVGSTVGGNTASTVSSVNQTQNNYLNHLQLQKWADQLKACDGEKYCIEGINDYYLNLEKKQQTEFINDCETNYNYEKCDKHIRNYYAGVELHKGNSLFDPKLYSKIDKLGGKQVYTTLRMNNGQFSMHTSQHELEVVRRKHGTAGVILTGAVMPVAGTRGPKLGIGRNNPNYNKSRHEVINDKVNSSKPIIQKDGYYYSDGMKMTEYYYNKLWSNGRSAPFIQAREIINGNPKVSLD
ncbi:hemagglutinin repeat-containing protein [Psychrobacter pygoscelis]|uniref:hemagglutinin repeat-containing protein n=1 Tax=Psychrobacter pygoscelis TaxID=2488563 RepID=UPI00103F55E2|nr:hemagglutinin repeat-containing protein [Psychrobacter pygoscelis]